jgi:hypothetical protein
MAYWLYQMSNDIWSTNKYRTEVWEGNNTTWPVGRLSPGGSQLHAGDTIVLFYTGNDPGIYGWAVLFRYEDKEIYFRPSPPSDYLKMNPLWNDQIKSIIDQIRGRVKRGTMWEIDVNLMKNLRERITQDIYKL